MQYQLPYTIPHRTILVSLSRDIYKTKREGDWRSGIDLNIRLGISLTAEPVGPPEG